MSYMYVIVMATLTFLYHTMTSQNDFQRTLPIKQRFLQVFILSFMISFLLLFSKEVLQQKKHLVLLIITFYYITCAFMTDFWFLCIS